MDGEFTDIQVLHARLGFAMDPAAWIKGLYPLEHDVEVIEGGEGPKAGVPEPGEVEGPVRVDNRQGQRRVRHDNADLANQAALPLGLLGQNAQGVKGRLATVPAEVLGVLGDKLH